MSENSEDEEENKKFLRDVGGFRVRHNIEDFKTGEIQV